MRISTTWPLIGLSVLIGFLAGCIIPDCEDYVCGPIMSGSYRVFKHSDSLDNLEEGRGEIDETSVVLSYSRADGSKWRVVFRR